MPAVHFLPTFSENSGAELPQGCYIEEYNNWQNNLK
jgi:hypothetical protein